MGTVSFEQVLNTDGKLVYKSFGISMLPLICEGRDFIYISKRPEKRLNKYDVVLFKRSDSDGRDSYVLHRILKVNPDGTYWIVGDNCITGDIVRDESIIGILTAVKRRDKTIKTSDLRYKLYTYLWCAPYHLRTYVLKHKNVPKRIKNRIFNQNKFKNKKKES